MVKSPNRREFIGSLSVLTFTSIAGCSGSESDVQDSDGDGMIDNEDYAPDDPDVQEKSDIQSAEQTEQSDSTPAEQSVQARIGAVDVDVQVDIGQNNIGFDVETYFEGSAVLTVIVSDGEASDQRSFEATATDGFQEFNDDIDPPDTFQDDEEFIITFTLSADGEVVDEKRFTHTYSE